jgi:hypothetical protein
MRSLTFIICVFCVLLFAVKIRANPVSPSAYPVGNSQYTPVNNKEAVPLKPVRSVNPNTCTYQFEVAVEGVKIKIRPGNFTNASIGTALSRRLIFDIGDLSYFQAAKGLEKVSSIPSRAQERKNQGLKPLNAVANLSAYSGQKVDSSAMLYMVRQDLSNEQKKNNVPRSWGEVLELTFPNNQDVSVKIFSERLYRDGKDSLVLESNRVKNALNQSSLRNVIDQQTLKSLFVPVQGADLQKCKVTPAAPSKARPSRNAR